MEELKGRAKKVFRIMDENEGARNNDWTLMAHYIKRHYSQLTNLDADKDLVIKLRDLKKLPSWQSIRLARQVIQNEQGLLLPTDPKVTKLRKIKEKNIRDAEWREAKAEDYEVAQATIL
jgi:hypothetical protein